MRGLLFLRLVFVENTMRDAQSHHYHEQQENQQNWSIVRWCLKKGIPVEVVEGHPHFSDVSFLLDFRWEFEREYKTNATLLGTYNAYWRLVYSERKPLKPKAYRKLEVLAHECLRIRQQRQLQQQVIKKIRQLNTGTRQKPNKDHDITAKGSDLSQSKLVKGNQQGGREELRSSPPWE